MSNSEELKKNVFDKNQPRQSVVTSVWVPPPPPSFQQSQSTISKDNSKSESNQLYRSECTINLTPKTSIESSFRCNKCKRLIDNKSEGEIKFNNLYYHSNCFQCDNCHRNLDDSNDNQFKLNSNNEPICSKCQLLEAETCYICKTLIIDGGVIHFDKNSYHKNCFNCIQCQKCLVDQIKVHKDNSNAYCDQCYINQFAKRCQQCSKTIFNEKFTNYEGKDYHLDCFKCYQCNNIINDTKFMIYDSKPCCQTCYDEYIAPKCKQCFKPISIGKVINYNSNKYHEDCFRCFHCDKVIEERQFSKDDSNIYCLKCYDKYIAPQCKQCFKSISNGKTITFNSNNYHEDCFRCCQCNKIMNESKFHTNNSKPCCIKCYDEYFAPKCNKCLKSICDGKITNYDDKKYHEDCFRCSHCNKVIREDKFSKEDSNIYCLKCYEEYIAPECQQCFKRISIGKTIIFNSNNYHEDCFRCCQCNKVMSESKFHTKNGKPCCIKCSDENIFERCGECNKVMHHSEVKTYNSKRCCNQCYDQYSSLKCGKCLKPIKDKYTKFEGKQFHIDCFVCVKCGHVIDDKQQFCNDQMGILCLKCAN